MKETWLLTASYSRKYTRDVAIDYLNIKEIFPKLLNLKYLELTFFSEKKIKNTFWDPQFAWLCVYFQVFYQLHDFCHCALRKSFALLIWCHFAVNVAELKPMEAYHWSLWEMYSGTDISTQNNGFCPKITEEYWL